MKKGLHIRLESQIPQQDLRVITVALSILIMYILRYLPLIHIL